MARRPKVERRKAKSEGLSTEYDGYQGRGAANREALMPRCVGLGTRRW
jgi:hypothetical protein